MLSLPGSHSSLGSIFGEGEKVLARTGWVKIPVAETIKKSLSGPEIKKHEAGLGPLRAIEIPM